MHRSLTDEIRDRLTVYLHGEITLDQFRDWFVPILWTVEDSNDTSAERLAYEIEALHSEYAHEHWSIEEFHGLLWNLAERPESVFSRSTGHAGTSNNHVNLAQKP